MSSQTRRRFLAQASLAGLAPFAVNARDLFAQTTYHASVKTPSGPLQGEGFEGVRMFRGVPFAQPPVGPLRFRPTVAVKPWKAERDATRFAQAAVQAGDTPHSEDCLYLNIWAPEGKGPFPVYVWIHGGSYVGGNSFSPTFNGSNFARDGVVCVTIAYRLGVLGFLDLEPLLGASYAGSANNGMRDCLTALTWVHENIGSFGGDPSRVTVGGASAGAKMACTLLGVPAARPLFHQAISQSGGAERFWPTAEAVKVARGFGDLWTAQSPLNDLTTAPADDLIKVQGRFMKTWPRGHSLRPEIEPNLLPQSPLAAIPSGLVRGKRLLIGTNLDESVSFIGPHPAHDDEPTDLGNMSTDTYSPVYARYKDIYPEMSVEMQRIRSTTAEEYWVPSVRTAEAAIRGGAETWMYRVDFSETSGPLKGDAFHGIEGGMVWGTPHTKVDNAAQEIALSAQMHEAWSSFILGSAPAGTGLPVWTPYTAEARSTMIFNVESRLESHPHAAELQLWKGLL